MNYCRRRCCNDQAAIAGTRKGFNLALDVSGVAKRNRDRLNAKRWRHRLDNSKLADRGGGRVP